MGKICLKLKNKIVYMYTHNISRTSQAARKSGCLIEHRAVAHLLFLGPGERSKLRHFSGVKISDLFILAVLIRI